MRLAAFLLALALPVTAQTIPEDHFKKAPPTPPEPPVVEAPLVRPPVQTRPGEAAELRGLDKMTGRVTSFPVKVGESFRYERLEIRLLACRMPPPEAPPDAFAYLEIRDVRQDRAAFSGWMLASSPALSALDHPRYDVWVLSCSTSSTDASTESDQN